MTAYWESFFEIMHDLWSFESPNKSFQIVCKIISEYGTNFKKPSVIGASVLFNINKRNLAPFNLESGLLSSLSQDEELYRT